jgi:hypothetical protein
MRADDDLTTLLRRGFARATADVDPEPDLVHVVRRRYGNARRRHLAVGVAIPAAALAVGSGFALAGRGVSNHTPGHPAAAPPPSAHATSHSTPRTGRITSVPMKPVSYRVVRHSPSGAPSCPANATAPVGKSENPAGAWFWTNGTCVFVGIQWSDTKPANASPVQMDGYPGLYGTLENGVRAIYAPVAPGTNSYHPKGGWVVLTLSANAPQDAAIRLIIVPAN